MTRRIVSEENVRNIQKSKRSYYVTLPIQVVREFRWKEGQKVIVERRGKEIVIKDWPGSRNLISRRRRQ
ncbi:MAG: AbrB/MazE/SpoVT family DNA-binding domain-containing protein [Candidatus Colwellbacteria bacterium]|nr:AbrB/MazE/SpoVT family DNA-binding domain-containing protein [Candidatus Colwellbacteria bacterium]